MSVGFHDEEKTHLEYVGRLKAKNERVGNFWISGGFNEWSSFANGFFFGPLDKYDAVTGKIQHNVINLNYESRF